MARRARLVGIEQVAGVEAMYAMLQTAARGEELIDGVVVELIESPTTKEGVLRSVKELLVELCRHNISLYPEACPHNILNRHDRVVGACRMQDK